MTKIETQKALAESLKERLGIELSVVISPSKIVAGKKNMTVFTKETDAANKIKAQVMKTGRAFFLGVEDVKALNEIAVTFELK